MNHDTTTKAPQQAPWCPRCGGEMVHKHETAQRWYVRCSGCDFHNSDDDDDQPAYKDRAEALYAARRLVRAELARQALEMRAHSAATQNMAHGCCLFTLSETILMVTNDYEWLGTHPLRLPGEGGL